MFNVGGAELLVILLVALIVLGPSRMPEAARTVGKVVGEVRRISSGFQREVREAFEEDDTSPRRKESTPLGSAVADLDAGDDEPDAPPEPEVLPEPDADEPAALSSDDVRNGNGNGTAGGQLAPEVEQALDEIVTPPPAEPEAS
jgi:sec-independent protein translocase protein TatB